jgi:ribosomal-protein-alanine N-acetyltransferase
MNGGAACTVRAESDSGLLASIHADCFAEAWTADAFASLLASPGCFALVARRATGGADPAGMILARVAGDDCEVITIGVRPGARRHGIATLLLDHACAPALGLGATRQVLEVGVQNAPARGLYASLGFAECGKRPGYYGVAGGDAVILARNIATVMDADTRE